MEVSHSPTCSEHRKPAIRMHYSMWSDNNGYLYLLNLKKQKQRLEQTKNSAAALHGSTI